jgi:hypothetical protein
LLKFVSLKKNCHFNCYWCTKRNKLLIFISFQRGLIIHWQNCTNANFLNCSSWPDAFNLKWGHKMYNMLQLKCSMLIVICLTLLILINVPNIFHPKCPISL